MNGKITKLKIKSDSPLRLINQLPNIGKISPIKGFFFKKSWNYQIIR